MSWKKYKEQKKRHDRGIELLKKDKLTLNEKRELLAILKRKKGIHEK